MFRVEDLEIILLYEFFGYCGLSLVAQNGSTLSKKKIYLDFSKRIFKVLLITINKLENLLIIYYN